MFNLLTHYIVSKGLYGNTQNYMQNKYNSVIDNRQDQEKVRVGEKMKLVYRMQVMLSCTPAFSSSKIKMKI